jgi:predicted KAP-like P-loop ATPase
MHLIDNETKVDLLNNEPIATTVVKLLRASADTAVTVGLHGDWGAGKSSLLAMIEAAFAEDKEISCLRFNGWQFQGSRTPRSCSSRGLSASSYDPARSRLRPWS